MILDSILRPLEQNPVTTSDDALGVLQRHHYIMAIGAIAKGLPDAPKPSSSSSSSAAEIRSPTQVNGAWIPGMVKATGVILTVLEGMKGLEVIREAVSMLAILMHGMDACVGSCFPLSLSLNFPFLLFLFFRRHDTQSQGW